MVVNRTLFFLSLFILLLLSFAADKLWWLAHAKTATGVFGFNGKGNALDQIKTTNHYASFIVNGDTVYFSNPGYLNWTPGDKVPVVYQPAHPTDARIFTVGGFWRSILVFGIVIFLLMGAVFVQPAIVPWRAKFHVRFKKPVLQLV